MNFSVPMQAVCASLKAKPSHSFRYFSVEDALLSSSQGKAKTTSCRWRGDQCLTNNSTYFDISTGNSTLVKHAKTQQIVGTLVNLSTEDVLLIQHQLQRERTYLGLYLYARKLSMSTSHREAFEQHARGQGLGAEAIVYAPWSTELCQVKEMGKGNSPHMEPTTVGTAPPPPGTQQPRSTDN